MRRTAAGLLAAAAVAGLVACGGKEQAAAPAKGTVEETGKEISKNPLQALQQVADAGKKMADKAQEAATKPPVEPVRFDVLLPFLPEIAGYTGDEPNGETTAMGEFKVTNVSRRYQGGSEEAPLTGEIQITDGGYVPMVYMPFHMMSQFSQESTRGYQKGITVAGYPGFEKWEKDSKSAELWVLVGDRFLVHLRSGDAPEGTLRKWVEGIDLGKLATLG